MMPYSLVPEFQVPGRPKNYVKTDLKLWYWNVAEWVIHDRLQNRPLWFGAQEIETLLRHAVLKRGVLVCTRGGP